MDTQKLFSLEGRTALITGGSRGIGRMIAHGFLAHGARVYISSRKEQECEATAQALSAYGFCKALPFDVSTVHGCQELARSVGVHEPHLDILVNNAGAAWGEAFDTFPESGWDKVVDLNMKSPFFLTQALHPALMGSVVANAGRKAKVINIASIDGISINSWDTYSYTASKAGLIHLTKRMAMHLIEQGIVCNAIAPGPFASSMNKEARDHGDKVASRVPARRVGRDEDMAAAAIYLASDASDYVLGHTLVVDGGTSMARG